MTALCRQVTVVNKLGLHARAATRLAQLAAGYRATITLHLDEQQANANSIFGLLMLQGCRGRTITVCCDGDDADAALSAVCELFACRFDEAE
ncbi:HPr family phosphocarrier protein [Ferrimonas senticii]|uniref:HPr family phosphocarrier protein n=1 Tax=Ferrimonas senticii TaxID=394566 RepID=UPI0004195A2F|nr:HPr family phosphocarrier protein [Ferrimonas senticii]